MRKRENDLGTWPLFFNFGRICLNFVFEIFIFQSNFRQAALRFLRRKLGARGPARCCSGAAASAIPGWPSPAVAARDDSEPGLWLS